MDSLGGRMSLCREISRAQCARAQYCQPTTLEDLPPIGFHTFSPAMEISFLRCAIIACFSMDSRENRPAWASILSAAKATVISWVSAARLKSRHFQN
jgi:hypothetical protein